MRTTYVRTVCLLALQLICQTLASGQQVEAPRAVELDDPADAERLNRELWESITGLPFAAVAGHVNRGQRESAPKGAVVTLPNGWNLAPAGAQVEVGRLPYTAVPFGGKIAVLNTGYYTGTDRPELSLVDPDTGTVLRTRQFPSLFPSAITIANELYLSSGIDQHVYRVDSSLNPVAAYAVNGYAGALVQLDADRLAVACLVASDTPVNFTRGLYRQGKLVVINIRTGAIEKETPLGYFPYALGVAGGKLYAALLGEGTVQVYDADLKPIKTIKVGVSPQQVVVDRDTVYVVNANSDSVSLIDVGRDEVRATVDLASDHTRFGSAPTSIAIDADRLYVTMANINAIAVFDKSSRRRLGSIPTGWYPTCVIADRDRLIYLSAKGIRPRRPNPGGPQPDPGPRNGKDYVLTLLTGAVGIIPKTEVDGRLHEWTRTVRQGAPIFSADAGLSLPIKHIFYIVRENRTFDQVMGDLPRANGDAFLTLFGREVTPNGHRLADEFVTLDNYFADGEISVLGHSFTTSGYASPFLEWLGNMTYSGRYNSYPFGTVPAVTSPAYLWDALDRKHVDYRIYGENYYLYTRGYDILRDMFGPDSELARKFYARMMSLATVTDRGNQFYNFAHTYYGRARTVRDAEKLLSDAEFVKALSGFLVGDESLAASISGRPILRRRFAEYLYRYPFNYRSWDLGFSDLDRAAVWKADFEDQVKRNRVAQLHYLWLPNDHTAGAARIPLPPDQLVAQNDAALGKIIETISHSPVWNESLILVTEDDAQNGPDHVDATRTVCLAIGPYVKRGQVVSDRYDQLSLLRTIELLLGLAPLNRSDALAVPMLGIFTDQPDFRSYENPELSAHLSDPDRARALAFPRISTSR